jgi:plastocyanin
LAQDASFVRTFPSAGTFPYHCAIHPSMKATVIVE